MGGGGRVSYQRELRRKEKEEERSEKLWDYMQLSVALPSPGKLVCFPLPVKAEGAPRSER